ncbi:M15 family metallopeptidase [Flavobacterium succinicans]|uniref:D-alanyl-D-alanine dipeptidase n=1 Tax=Flavobacterium succinicans TaxID=29536 RepID=A0A199XW64_9FLAO|nr:M15 family metallopeptidase [Flavobacterium succinicans]OAZ05501.1 D-alanyl-D-alanine dipeptidase [Flavobacterium succinicans]
MRFILLFSFFLLFSSIYFKVYSQTSERQLVTKNRLMSSLSDTTFVNLKDYSQDFVYDMKYATTDNFLKSKVYDCAACFLRWKTVKALIKANDTFIQKGYKIKLFDCYRPLDIQKKMWKIVSNPEYVADPAKGSIHNRGGAVDLTLVTLEGKELEMGTAFDFFGKEASHGYPFPDKKVMDNRKMLKKIMLQNGFMAFESEWWHYNLASGLTDKVANTKWECD